MLSAKRQNHKGNARPAKCEATTLFGIKGGVYVRGFLKQRRDDWLIGENTHAQSIGRLGNHLPVRDVSASIPFCSEPFPRVQALQHNLPPQDKKYL